MKDELVDSLRDLLRRDTAEAHQIVDSLFSSRDLSTETGYRSFLHAQAIAWETLRPMLDVGSTARGDALRRDLDALGMDVPGPLADIELPTAASDGHRYVLEGSRLGSTVLLRQLSAGAPQMARRASFFLVESSKLDGWKTLSTRLQMKRIHRGTEQEIIGDALFIFGLFERSWRAADGVPPR